MMFQLTFPTRCHTLNPLYREIREILEPSLMFTHFAYIIRCIGAPASYQIIESSLDMNK